MLERAAVGIILLRLLLRTFILSSAPSKGSEENIGQAEGTLASSLPLVACWYLGTFSRGQEEGELLEMGDPLVATHPLRIPFFVFVFVLKPGQIPQWLSSLKSGLCASRCFLSDQRDT